MFAKAWLAQVLLDTAFEEAVAGGGRVKPWYYADMWPVARVVVPRIGASAVVLNSDSGQALAFGPGHVGGTPLPGEPGTSVLAAHRDTHFSFLGKLKFGDAIEVTGTDGRRSVFSVRESRVARHDASELRADRKGRWLALATCWPLDATTPGPMRLIVEAEMTSASAIPK